MPAVAVSPAISQVMEAVIARDRLFDSLSYNETLLRTQNQPLHNCVVETADRYARPFVDEFGEMAAAFINSTFCVGSYTSYMALSLEQDGKLPRVYPMSLEEALLSPQASEIRGHQWHFAVASDANLHSVLMKVMEAANDEAAASIRVQRALLSGAGLVSFVLNNHLARHN